MATYDKCNDPTCSSAGTSHSHIELSREDIEAYKAIHHAAQLAHMGDEIERTRTVKTHDYNDLLDHLQSDNGHMLDHAKWRNSHEEHIPGVSPQGYDDREMTHRELIALHQHEHNKYPDEKHTTLNGEHFHH